ncbi:MAG: hypothetical protein M3P26_10440 [Gemmatimonadota bacterium]|nr:hypothetical protein [Gemmatimonadota bacterium]
MDLAPLTIEYETIVGQLATEAHSAVHLLLALGRAIKEADAATECTAQADKLGQALRSVIRHRNGRAHQYPNPTNQQWDPLSGETQINPVFAGKSVLKAEESL